MSKTRAELLLHPIIPPPLHGLAPRVILGQKWWDAERKKAYAKNDECCLACGVHKSKAWYHRTASPNKFKSLEGHEAYEIDYETCTVKLKEVVALCHSCHNFIHAGLLLRKLTEGVVSRNYVTNVLDYGVTVLSNAGLQPRATQAIHWLMLKKGYNKYDAIEYVIKAKLDREQFDPFFWDNWKIIIDGKSYSGKTQTEWSEQYEQEIQE